MIPWKNIAWDKEHRRKAWYWAYQQTKSVSTMGSHRVGHDWSDLAAAAALKKLFLQHKLISSSDDIMHYELFFFSFFEE